MKRAELEQVRALVRSAEARDVGMFNAYIRPTYSRVENAASDLDLHLHDIRQALALLDAELAKPEALEWGVKHRDGALYFLRADEQRARRDCESGVFELFCRTRGFSTPAGPWQVAEEEEKTRER